MIFKTLLKSLVLMVFTCVVSQGVHYKLQVQQDSIADEDGEWHDVHSTTIEAKFFGPGAPPADFESLRVHDVAEKIASDLGFKTRGDVTLQLSVDDASRIDPLIDLLDAIRTGPRNFLRIESIQLIRFPEESRSILEEKIENAREAIRRIVERQQELTAAREERRRQRQEDLDESNPGAQASDSD